MAARQNRDSGWKEIIEKYFPQFLEFYFPEIYADIDFTDYSFLDKELQSVTKGNEIGRRYADKLVSVNLKEGDEKWLLIHIEVQGEPEEGFEKRLFIYNYRIFDKYDRDVVSLAVLADRCETFRPSSYEIKRWGFRLLFEFLPTKLLDFKNRTDELEKSANPFAIATNTHLRLIEAGNDSERKLFWKITLARSLYQKGYSRKDVVNLYRFIDWIITLPEQLEIVFHENIIRYEEAMKMPYITTAERIGMRKGIEKGIEKGKMEVAQELKKMGQDIETIMKATGLSKEVIEKL